MQLPPPFIEPREPDLRAELEAMRCLEECKQHLRLRGIPLPVPVERWVEHPLGCDVGIEARPGADGFNYLGTKIIRISPDIVDRDTRFRWVMAHELGHARLHTPSSPRLRHDDPSYDNLYANEVERQAQRFAAAFLMPLNQIVKALFDACIAYGLTPDNTIPKLLRRLPETVRLWSTVFLPFLSHRFGVTRYGVVFRMGELRLFDGAPLMLPRHVVLLSPVFSK